MDIEFDIKKFIGKPALLEQLAEEAAELGKAALKYARILRRENPTPVTEPEALRALIEEYTDVVHCGLELDIVPDQEQMVLKNKRWHDRLEEVRYQD